MTAIAFFPLGQDNPDRVKLAMLAKQVLTA